MQQTTPNTVEHPSVQPKLTFQHHLQKYCQLKYNTDGKSEFDEFIRGTTYQQDWDKACKVMLGDDLADEVHGIFSAALVSDHPQILGENIFYEQFWPKILKDISSGKQNEEKISSYGKKKKEIAELQQENLNLRQENDNLKKVPLELSSKIAEQEKVIGVLNNTINELRVYKEIGELFSELIEKFAELKLKKNHLNSKEVKKEEEKDK